MPYDISNFELLKAMLQQVPADDSCMEWPRARHKQGYGRFEINGKLTLVHRISYEITFGPLDGSIDLLHKCDNPPCFRPDHLFRGNQGDNMKDCAAKGRTKKTVKLTPQIVEEIRSLYSAGAFQKDLARRFSVSAPAIHDIVRGEHWKNAPGAVSLIDGRGRHDGLGGAKITAEMVTSIRSKYATGLVRQHTLAQEYGLKQSTISKITLGQRWKRT